MIEVRPIVAEDFDLVFPLLNDLNPSLGEAGWRTIFDYPWPNKEPFCGYALFADGEVVGYHGFIFSERNIEGRNHRFCNLTSWYVREAYRGHSMKLLMPIRKLKEHTVTDLSAGNTVTKILRRFGFESLDESVHILLPWWTGTKHSGISVYHDQELESQPLSESDRQIYQHHAGFQHIRQILIRSSDDYCLIVYGSQKQSGFSCNYVHWISNLDLFEEYQMLIRRHIMTTSRIPFIVLDERQVQSIQLQHSYTLPKHAPHMYRSPDLPPKQIDNLYSELTLIDFNTSWLLEITIREKVLNRLIPFINLLFGISSKN